MTQEIRPKALPGGLIHRVKPWLLIVALALVGAALALGSVTSWAKNRQDLLTQLREQGIGESHPDALKRVEREVTAHHSQLLAARSLVYDSLARLWQPGGVEDPELRKQVLQRLPAARTLAQSALKSEPGSWQAAMLVGASTYLERSLSHDRRLYTEPEAWEIPLRMAVERADGHPEARRLLATAYLETWFGLSDAKKAVTRDLLTQVFRDDLRAFEALLPAWLGLRLDAEETFSVVPDHSSAWKILAKGYAAEKRWGRFMTVHRRYLDSLEQNLDAQRLDAEERLRLGDFFTSRSRFLQVIAAAPPSGRFVPMINQVLQVYPPGLHGYKILGPLSDWLDWTLELGQLGHEPIPAESLTRLIDAVGKLDRPKAALASRLALDFYQAGRFEKLAQPLAEEAWAPYFVVKARMAVRAGELDVAKDALSKVALKFQRRPSYLLARLEVARASGDPVRLAGAEEALREVSVRRWSGFQWRWPRNQPILDILPGTEAEGFAFKVLKAPRDGAVIEVSWDGESILMQTARQGEIVRASVKVEPETLHLIEIKFVAGGTIRPGDLWLLPED